MKTEREKIYDMILDSNIRTMRRYKEYKRLLSFGKIKPKLKEGMSILDLGCGSGMAVYDMALEIGPTGRAMGADVNPRFTKPAAYYELLRKERRLKMPKDFYGKLLSAVNFVRFDAEQIPVKSNTFDAVFSVFSFDYFPNKIAAIREALRVLDQNGKLYVVTQFGRIIVTSEINELSSRLLAKLDRINNSALAPRRINYQIEQALIEEYSQRVKSYNLNAFLLTYFRGLKINFRSNSGVEIYEIEKMRKDIKLEGKLPQYLFAFPFKYRGRKNPPTFYNTVVHP